MQGTLYLCATPIGNLEDMTFRGNVTLHPVFAPCVVKIFNVVAAPERNVAHF